MPGGRPSKYDPNFCEVMISAMETEGLSLGAVAGLIGVSRDTLYEWTTVHPEFSYAKKVGKPRRSCFGSARTSPLRTTARQDQARQRRLSSRSRIEDGPTGEMWSNRSTQATRIIRLPSRP